MIRTKKRRGKRAQVPLSDEPLLERVARNFGIDLDELSQWVSQRQSVGRRTNPKIVGSSARGTRNPDKVDETENSVAQDKGQHGTSAQHKLRVLVDLLSELEAERLLPAIDDIVAGERFWQDDAGLFYNEYVKTRHISLARGHTGLISAELGNNGSYYAPVPVPDAHREQGWISLPTPRPIAASLTQLLRDRRSRRDYAEISVSLVELATLLEHACGVTGTVSAYGYQNLALRTFPSTGGLQSPDVYIFARNIEQLEKGLYQYHPLSRSLEIIEHRDHWPVLRPIFLGHSAIDRAAAAIVVVGNYARVKWKYGARSYRYMCMDIGFLGQNLQLAAEGLGIGSCPIAAFVEDGLEQLLRIDGKEQFALLGWTFGPVPARP
jgi:SagB-type dehydrogenase family enzyme